MKKIKLSGKLGAGKFTLVDDRDFKMLNGYRWRVATLGYVVREKENIYMHRVIAKPPMDMVVDHIDGDKLDNRRKNLRICFTWQNTKNRKVSKNNISGFKGVIWHKRDKKWQAYIRIDYKKYFLGYFLNKEDAIKKYNKEAKKLFGKFYKKI